MTAFDELAGGVVVSAQVMDERSPLGDAETLVRLALAAELGGAVGFRVNGSEVVSALRPRTGRPIIGIEKDRIAAADNYITTTIAAAIALRRAGADIVAAQATAGSRAGDAFEDIARACHAEGALVMADIATKDEAVAAVAAGADAVATTMVGFTAETDGQDRPALTLVRELVSALDVPVIVEGGVWTPEAVRESFAAGAHAVVVGAAVTAPDLITRRLADAAAAARELAPDAAERCAR